MITNPEWASAQSFAPWQQATIEFTCHDHSIIACSRHIHIFLFFAHIQFVVNHRINATPLERLQHYHSHIQRVHSKCMKRLILLRMPTGTTWGADKKPLLHIYRAIVRSVVEYGMEAYFFICFFSRKTQQNTICRAAPVYKGKEKNTFTLSSPFL